MHSDNITYNMHPLAVPSDPQRYEASADVLSAMKALKEAGEVKKWGKIMEDRPQRRNVFLGDLKQVCAWSCPLGYVLHSALQTARIAANASALATKTQQASVCLLVLDRRWESKSHPLWPFPRYVFGRVACVHLYVCTVSSSEPHSVCFVYRVLMHPF